MRKTEYSVVLLLVATTALGCGGRGEQVTVELPGGGTLINSIEPSNGADRVYENHYAYLPPGADTPETICQSSGEADRDLQSDGAAGDAGRPTELLSGNSLVVFRPRPPDPEAGERIFVRTAPGSWTEHALEEAYREHPSWTKDLRSLDLELTAPARVVGIDMGLQEIVAHVTWGYQLRELTFAFAEDRLVLLYANRRPGDSREQELWSSRGESWDLPAAVTRTKQAFMVVKEHQVMAGAHIVPRGGLLGAWTSQNLLDTVALPGELVGLVRSLVLKDQRIVQARDCTDDSRDLLRVYYEGILTNDQTYSELWRFVPGDEDWIADAIELENPTLQQIQELTSAAPPPDCTTLR